MPNTVAIVKLVTSQEISTLSTNIISEIRINYQLDVIDYLFTLARHVSGLYAHLHEQWML
jgi:hypothetical protein